MLQRALNKLPITSITPFTFQDYPENTACILWFSGCNMSCSYCHNPELVKGELRKLPFEQVASFLESRKGLLEGVVLSGGECTLSPQLPEFAVYLKSLGYKIKLDTNGCNPETIKYLLYEKLLDFVALDFKSPRYLFADITGSDAYDLFETSLTQLLDDGVELEIRTTVHADLLSEPDVNNIIADLEGRGFRGKYYLQNFRRSNTLGNLQAPMRNFDISKIIKPSFEIRYRNF